MSASSVFNALKNYSLDYFINEAPGAYAELMFDLGHPSFWAGDVLGQYVAAGYGEFSEAMKTYFNLFWDVQTGLYFDYDLGFVDYGDIYGDG